MTPLFTRTLRSPPPNMNFVATGLCKSEFAKKQLQRVSPISKDTITVIFKFESSFTRTKLTDEVRLKAFVVPFTPFNGTKTFLSITLPCLTFRVSAMKNYFYHINLFVQFISLLKRLG